MRKVRWVSILLLMAILLPLLGCSQPEVQTTTPPSYEPTVVPAPKGSIIDEDVSLRSQAGGFINMEESALVQNIGNDGVITVYFEFQRCDMTEPQRQSKQIYLRQGEEKRLSFDFTTKLNCKYTKRVWCVP